MELPNQKPMPPEAPKHAGDVEKVKEVTVKTLAVLGLIAILSLFTYGIVKYAPTAVKTIARSAVSLSSKFSGSNSDTLTVLSDKKKIDSGEAFTLTWTNKDTAEGSYSLSYPCQNGVHLESLDRDTAEVVFCNTNFRFASESNSITIAAFSTKLDSTNLPIYLNFTRTDDRAPAFEAKAKITITNSDAGSSVEPTPTPTPTPAPRPTPRPTPQAGPQTQNSYPIPSTGSTISDPNGYVDLSARIIATGYIDQTTNAFVPAPETRIRQKGAVKFAVENVGTKVSPVWRFNAVLPTYPSFIFHSEDQINLLPGDRIEFVLGFDKIAYQNENTVTINVDPTSSINEKSKDNNIVRANIHVNLSN